MLAIHSKATRLLSSSDLRQYHYLHRMIISKIDIKNFRSIENISFLPKSATVICGANSSGKSNILRAIRLAFLKDIDSQKLSENYPNNASATAKCKIELTFDAPNASIQKLFGIKKDQPFIYKFEFRKSGKITRSINSTAINDEAFNEFSESILTHPPCKCNLFCIS